MKSSSSTRIGGCRWCRVAGATPFFQASSEVWRAWRASSGSAGRSSGPPVVQLAGIGRNDVDHQARRPRVGGVVDGSDIGLSIRVGTEDLGAVARPEGAPGRNAYRILDESDRAVGQAQVD